jgi:transcriptional regulator with XRE-family HTH domain
VNIKRVAADNIRFIRQKRGLTQEALAFDSDIARSYIGYIERAEKTLSIVSLQKIAKALGVKPSLLLEPEAYRKENL